MRRSPLAVAVVLSLAGTGFLAAASADEAEREDRDERATRTEEVVVTAKGTAADVPDALATDVVRHEDAVARPADFQDLVTRVPGVGSTGQNGLFETFSIRGSGANNVAILFAGMPLTAQRRAGVPVSFVEPSLLGDVAVTKGPAVVHYGPGALGGAVSIEPRWFDSPYANASYARGGDESVLAAGVGGDTFSLGAARHRANDARAPDGTPLHTRYDRVSAVAQYRAQLGDFDLDAMLSPSRTEDIGKSNSRYPARETLYPHDEHTVGRVRLRDASGFEASVQAHAQDLRTVNRRPGFADTYADVQGLDIGATVQHAFARGDVAYDFGMEYLGRRDVDAFDASGTIDDRRYTLRDAREDNLSLFAIADWAIVPRVALELGARWTAIEQEQGGAEDDDADAAFTTGAVWTPVDAHRVSVNLARGYRFASLEERFFTGVTAQGEVAGNPALRSERSLGIDFGHAWRGAHWRTEVHVWRNDIDDLIQLAPVAPGLNGFENVSAATLRGFEAMVGWTPNDAFALRGTLARVDSEDERSGAPLFGTPPVTAQLEAQYRFADAWSFAARYERRRAHDEPGFEEVRRDAVDIVDAEITYRPVSMLELGLHVRNLFDESYFATADALSALAPERSIGISVTWQGR